MFFEAEYMVKSLSQQGYNFDEINELYNNLEHLYTIEFIKFVNGKISSSDELITNILEIIINKDKDYLNISIPFINANQKSGMLQQLANDLEKDIWWAKEHSIKDIDELRKAKIKDEI